MRLMVVGMPTVMENLIVLLLETWKEYNILYVKLAGCNFSGSDCKSLSAFSISSFNFKFYLKVYVTVVL